jgi:hypothetical protein
MFRDFWGTYGQFIGIFAGAFIGAFAKVLFDRRNMNLQNRWKIRVRISRC